jgi:hypothetical protein
MTFLIGVGGSTTCVGLSIRPPSYPHVSILSFTTSLTCSTVPKGNVSWTDMVPSRVSLSPSKDWSITIYIEGIRETCLICADVFLIRRSPILVFKGLARVLSILYL